MAVRESLLGILTLGPAYGLQLHFELGSRAPHRRKTNVGQIYGTLERLTQAGLVHHDGVTSDGLPLYSLTTAGFSFAEAWLAGDNVPLMKVAPDWSDFLDHVLISRSIESDAAAELIERYRDLFAGLISATEVDLSGKAEQHYLRAAQSWLDDAVQDIEAAGVPYQDNRPKRGRPKTGS